MMQSRAPLALIVGQDRQETPLRYLARGMRAEGWEVSVINPDEFLFRAPTLVGRAVVKLTEPISYRALGDAVMSRAAAIRPDIVLAIKSLPLSGAQRITLRRQGTKLAIWYPDVSFDHGIAVDADSLGDIDFFATSKHFHLPYMAARFPDLPTHLVEHGYCDDVHHPINPRPPVNFDVAYVGNPSPPKLAAIQLLANARPELRIGVCGNGWQPDHRWTTVSGLAGEEMARFLSSARLALGVHYGPHGRDGWLDTTSARTFEIPACGVFMLHPDNDEVRRYFEPDREIGVYGDLDDMVKQADLWLADDARRAQAAARACERARPQYSYSARGKKLARWLAAEGLGAA